MFYLRDQDITVKIMRTEQLILAYTIPLAKPALKWADGKQQLLNVLLPKISKKI